MCQNNTKTWEVDIFSQEFLSLTLPSLLFGKVEAKGKKKKSF